MAKQAAKQVGRAVVRSILTNPYVAIPLAIIVVILIIILTIFVLTSSGGNLGNGPPAYPSTESQRQQATLLSALSGNKIANDQIVKKVSDAEKSRYQRIKANAQKYSGASVAAIEQKIKEFNPLLDSLVATRNLEERKQINKDLEQKMLSFEGTLPFGKWISSIADQYASQGAGSTGFCLITRAAPNVACASFVSTVLWEAGVPNAIVPSVDELWTSAATRIVVDRPSSKSTSLYSQNESKLRPGDIIFWGNGACNRGGSALFDHVGIFISANRVANNSSTRKKIAYSRAEKNGGCEIFNGAKRYGADL
jgi:hypothetical protein